MTLQNRKLQDEVVQLRKQLQQNNSQVQSSVTDFICRAIHKLQHFYIVIVKEHDCSIIIHIEL